MRDSHTENGSVHFASCKRALLSLKSTIGLALLTPVIAQSNILNEWSFDLDANGSELIQAINSGDYGDNWSNTKAGFSIYKGRLLGENDADPAAGQTRFNTGYFAKSELATAITGNTYLRVDFSYDFSSPQNDIGSIALFSLRDSNNKDWGIRVHYNQSSGAISLQRGSAGIWQDLQAVPLNGSIHAVIAYNLGSDSIDYHLDLNGSGNLPVLPSYSFSSVGLTGLSFGEYRMHLTGDLLATAVPAIAVENFRHADSFTDATSEISYLHRLSPTEKAWLENDLSITIDTANSETVASIVKAASPEQWRSDADTRIESYRKANLQLNLIDTYGRPVSNASVDIELDSHDFVFGGILRAKHFAGVEDNIDTGTYKTNALKFFNCFGLQNALKPKLRNGHEQYLPGFFAWANANGIPVRGHSLLWPGNPSKDHLTPTVRALLEACYDATPENLDTAKAALAQGILDDITEWAGLWDVYEWDVMNEPVSNHEVQDMLGVDAMADWFATAKNEAIDPNAGMLVNDFQIISAPSTVAGWPQNTYTSRSTDYKAVLDQLIGDQAPLDAIGFQSRFGWERTDPVLLYTRLEEFAAYNLPMAGTEFEVKSRAYDANLNYEFAPSEALRAQITGEVLRTYYSHPSVYAFNAWTFYNDDYGFFMLDGTPKLNALVWYYLTKLQWHTAESLQTDTAGQTNLRGFLGTYDLNVEHAGNQYTKTIFLGADGSIDIEIAIDSDGDGQLDDVDTDDDNDGYADSIDYYPTDNTRWNEAPEWNASSFNGPDANEDQAYNAWINWRASDVDDSNLSFAKVSGPAWLVVSDNGNLSGTPSAANVGSYQYTVSVSDGFNAPVEATLAITVVAAPPVWSELVYEDFEAGFVQFTGDGNDGRLYTKTTYAHQGSNAGLIRDNTNSSVIEQVNAIDASALLEVRIEFWYRAESMDNDEDFWLQYWDGSAWLNIEEYEHLVDFQNGEFKQVSLNLDPNVYTLTNSFKIRFRCDASRNSDKVYIDEIRVSGLQ